jgi:formate/nitrite transporter FocA (FNT family)
MTELNPLTTSEVSSNVRSKLAPARVPLPVPPITLDAFIPPEMAAKAEEVGVKKATMGLRNTFFLSIMAGQFIALGAIFAITVATGSGGQLTFGVTKLLTGLVFSLGPVLRGRTGLSAAMCLVQCVTLFGAVIGALSAPT